MHRTTGIVIQALCALFALIPQGGIDPAYTQHGGTHRPVIEPLLKTGRTAVGRVQEPARKPDYRQKTIRDAYARLMRYHTAALDERAATSGREIKPEDYVTFELRDMHTAPIKEISNHQGAGFLTPPSKQVLQVTPHHVRSEDGPEHAYYDLEWTGHASSEERREREAVSVPLWDGGLDLGDVESFTSYEVTVRLAGKTRVYRALALHHGQLDSSGRPKTEIIDKIVPGMNEVMADESPRIRSPWAKYVKTALYIAVARVIRETIQAHRTLIPADAPIGYLPGDGVTPSLRDTRALLAVACAAPTVSISFSQSGVPLCNLEPAPPGAAAYACSVQMTAAGNPSGGTYSWTKSNMNVGLDQQTSQTVTVLGLSESAARQDTIITVTYTLNGQQATAQVAVTVQKPTFMEFVTVDYNRRIANPPSGMAGWEKGITWQVKDKFHDSMTFVMATWDTINNTTPNSCFTPAQGGGTLPTEGQATGSTGLWSHQYDNTSTACINSGTCEVTGSQQYTVNGFNISLPYTMTCTSITVAGH